MSTTRDYLEALDAAIDAADGSDLFLAWNKHGVIQGTFFLFESKVRFSIREDEDGFSFDAENGKVELFSYVLKSYDFRRCLDEVMTNLAMHPEHYVHWQVGTCWSDVDPSKLAGSLSYYAEYEDAMKMALNYGTCPTRLVLNTYGKDYLGKKFKPLVAKVHLVHN